MKNATLLAVACSLLVAAPAFAVSLLSEPFSYADGDIAVVSGGAWAIHSGTTDVKIVSGQAEVSMSRSADVNRLIGAQGPAATTYACFEATVTSFTTPVSGSGETYFAHFKNASTGFRCRVFVAPPAGGGDFRFGVTVSSTNVDPAVANFGTYWGADGTIGTPYKIAMKYDDAAGVATVWVDPVTEASASISSSTSSSTIPGANIESFALRQSNEDSSVFTVLVDNLEVGTTFVDVCPDATPTTQTSFGRIKALYR
jgi:hypothetical protein